MNVQVVKRIIIRNILKILWIFPIKEKQIFFSAYEGKQYSCNPKAVFEAIQNLNAFSEYNYIWELNNQSTREIFPKNNKVKFVKHNTLNYIYNMMISKYIITNSGVTATIPLRKEQINVNTWHGGGAFKKVGFACKEQLQNQVEKYQLTLSGKQTTFFVSSSRIFTEVMKKSVNIEIDKFLTIGMPRNDIFFDKRRIKEAKEKVYTFYKLRNDDHIVLYAPTYRGKIGNDTFQYSLDEKKLIESLQNRFSGKWILFERTHYYNASINKGSGISANDYPDMQDLLACADILITDYSSSMWDFALTKRPCFLYTPDLDEYYNERGFYTPISTWPGILCKSNEALYMAIKELNLNDYADSIEEYLKKSGNADSGNATKKLIDILWK